MSTSDIRPPRDGHVTEDLPALIGGELDLGATRRVTGHLRACDDCRRELVEVTAGIGLMRRLDSAASASDSGVHRVGVRTVPASRRPALWLGAAAALLVVVTVVTASFVATRDGDDARTVVTFAPVESTDASGSVAMRESGDAQAMVVDTSLDTVPPAHYYEVWLLNRDSGKMLPVGVLPPEGAGTYRLPSMILEQYDSVDISLQRDDGTTDHSSASVLRADYA